MTSSPAPSRHRPTIAEIDLDALELNLGEVRRLAGRARVAAVVKANAYGHGAIAVAHALQQAGVESLVVALVEEGIALRDSGIVAPILVLDGLYADYDELLARELTPIVYSTEHLAGLQRAATRAGRQVRVHLKLDTGMGRIGLRPDELPGFLDVLKNAPAVTIEGFASHFASADLPDDPSVPAQIARYRDALALLRRAGHSPAFRHLANSSAVLDLPEVRDGFELNVVRPGIMLYGEFPADHFRSACALRPVLTWKTAVAQLKRVPAGTRISYGGTWTARRDTLIATLPVGYADGYNRRLSSQGDAPVGRVLVRGMRAPITGRVCMDMCMADVTDVPGVAVHDEVVLLGAQGSERIAAQEMADWCGTLHYEVLCAVGARVPRVIVGGSR